MAYENLSGITLLPDLAFLTHYRNNGQKFKGQEIKEKYKSYLINHAFSTLEYVKNNGQAEESKKTVLNNLKKKFNAHKCLWAEELSNVLWAYRTIPKVYGKSPFSLCYGSEAILPTEFLESTTKSDVVTDPVHDHSLAFEADLLEGKRDCVYIHLTNYQQMIQRYYNQTVKPRKF